MGSNSSKVQQTTVQNIQTNLDAKANAQTENLCLVSNVKIHGTCSPRIHNTCNTTVKLSSEAILTQEVSAVQAAEVNQTAGMFSFLGFNSQSTKEEIKQTIGTSVGNSCDIINNQQAIIQNLDIFTTARPCLRPIEIYNFGNSDLTCYLYTSLNNFVAADSAVSVDQSTGLDFGSSGGKSSGAGVLYVIVVLIVLAGVVLLFARFRSNQKDKEKEKEKQKQRSSSRSKRSRSSERR